MPANLVFNSWHRKKFFNQPVSFCNDQIQIPLIKNIFWGHCLFILLLWMPCSHTNLGDRTDELLKSSTVRGKCEVAPPRSTRSTSKYSAPQPGEILTTEPFCYDLSEFSIFSISKVRNCAVIERKPCTQNCSHLISIIILAHHTQICVCQTLRLRVCKSVSGRK